MVALRPSAGEVGFGELVLLQPCPQDGGRREGWSPEHGQCSGRGREGRRAQGRGISYVHTTLPPPRQEVQLGSWLGLVQILSSCHTLVPASESWPPWTLCPFYFSSSLALISVWEAGDVVKGTEGTEAWTGCMGQVLN